MNTIKQLEIIRDSALDAFEYGIAEEYIKQISRIKEENETKKFIGIKPNWWQNTTEVYSKEFIEEVERKNGRL